MSAIYLSRIELQEFRSFSKIVVDLPPQPGVLIVHGPNGLGKSSFFDGIEWALTSTIDHFRTARKAPVEHYLRRWDALASQQTHIRLDFENHWLRRTLDGELDSNGVTEVTAFLQRSDWAKPISHLGRYLLLTHFLGQSTVSRMTHRDAKERWEFLQEPAQSDRAKQIVRALHGHGSSRMARAFERRKDDLVGEAKQLERLLSEEEQHWSEAQLAGAIDDQTVQREARRIHEGLSELLSRLQRSTEVGPDDTADLLESANILHAAVCDALLTFEEKLNRGRTHLRERQQAETDLMGIHAASKSLQERNDALGTKLIQIQYRLLRTNSLLAQSLVSHRKSQDDVRALAEYERVREAKSRAHLELSGARALMAGLVRKVEEADAEVRKSERLRAIVNKLLRQQAEAEEEFERVRAKLDQLSNVEEAAGNLLEATVSLGSLTDGHDDLGERVAAALQECQAADRRTRVSGGMVAETRRSVDAISAAVATISAQLPAEICDCPVCSTSFSSGEELRDRIRAAAERLAPSVAAIEEVFKEAVYHRDQAEAHYAVLTARANAIKEARSKVNEITSRLDKLLEGMTTDREARADQLPSLRATWEAAADRLTVQMRRTDRWLNHRVVGGASAVSGRWGRSIEARNELAASLANQRQAVGRLDIRLQDMTVEIDGIAGNLGIKPDVGSEVVTVMRRERSERQREAEVALASARANVQVAQSDESSTSASIAQVAAQLAELDSQAEGIRVRMNRIEHDWKSLNLGVPQMSADALDVPSRQITRLQKEIQSASQQLKMLRAGRLAWSRQERHRATLDYMRSLGGALQSSDRDSLRRALLERQSTLVNRSETVVRAKGIAQRADAEVSKRVEAFNEEFLAPLSSLMIRINRAILSDPEIGVELKIKSNKIEQRAMVGSGVPAFVSTLDPQLVHSEGQMAALAVSMLTAASLTFPWSRWPALIMDDPLQYNDIVHAAGFADMLSNLVLAHRYQILLSTHDPGQAEFLRRKFQAAGIPCTAVHLLGRGARGVEARFISSGFTPSS